MVRCCLVLLLLGYCGLAAAEPPPVTILPSANQAALDQPTQAAAEIALKLHQTRIDVSAENEPLQQVLQQIADEVGVAIDLDRKQFAELKVQVDAPVSIHLKDVRAENLLRILLRPFELVAVVRPGHVIVTSNEANEGYLLTTRYYPLRDLMIDEEGSFDGGEPFIDMITTCIVPEMWEELGGPGTVEVFEGGYGILQTHEMHQTIEQLIAALREIQAMPDDQYDVTPRLLAADPQEYEQTREAVRSLSVTLKADQLLLDQVIAHLASETGLNIVLDSSILQPTPEVEGPPVPEVIEARRVDQVLEAGQKENEPRITGNWQDRPLEQILDQITLNHRFPWTIEGNVVRIADMQRHPEINESLLVKVYPVRDLRSHRDRPPMNPWNQQWMQFFDHGSWGSPCPSRFPVSWPPSKWLDGLDPYHQLKDCLEFTIDPESWEALGGPGTLVSHPGLDCLVVAQELRLHEKLERFLQQIRANRQRLDEPAADDAAGQDATEPDDPLLVHSYFFLADPTTGKLLLEESEFHQLCRRAAKMIEPDSWDEGEVFMELLSDRVIVRHRKSVQRQLDQFFNATRLITNLDPTDARQIRGLRFTPYQPPQETKDD